MAKSELEILIKARNTAKAEFDKLNGQVNTLKGSSGGLSSKLSELDGKFKSVTGMSLGFATAAGAAGMAINGVVKFLKDAVNETVAYATEVDNMSRLLGLSTEETSRLIQASDDLFVSQETLKSGLQAATRQGIDVSIDGLKKLADEYNKLPEGVTRSKFVLDSFGRSGAEMGKLLEIGADGIDKATESIADNLIVTKQSMKNIMNYKRSVDNLSDAWQGFKYQVGSSVIPQLDLLIRQMTKGKDEVEEYYEKINALNEQLVHLKKYGAMSGLSQEELASQIKMVENAIANAGSELDDYMQAAEEAAKEQEILNGRLNDLKTIMGGSVSKEIKDFNERLKDNAEKTQEIKDKIDELNGKSWLTEEQKSQLSDLEQDLIDVRGEAVKLKQEHEIAMKTMAMNMLITKASSDGLTENEVTNIGNIMVAWGLWDQKTAAVVKNINGINLDDANLEISTLKNNIFGIPASKSFTLFVKGVIDSSFAEALQAAGGKAYLGITDEGESKRGKAGGGSASGLTWVGEQGPELVNLPQGSHVYTAPQSARMGGGATINFIYSPALSLSDRTEAETKLIPILKRLLANA